MIIYIGSDHGGFELKGKLKAWLEGQTYTVIDCGAASLDLDDDFPDFAFAVAEHVAKDPESRGIVLCHSGGGVTIAANKISGIRCTTAASVEDVKHNRSHDDINILAIGADATDFEMAKQYVTLFLDTEFSGDERYVRRIQKIEAKESECCGECGGTDGDGCCGNRTSE